MNLAFLVGLVGALTLVLGAAYPATPVPHPTKSLKNWLFASGGLLMLVYSTLNFWDGGAFFFVILQLLVNVSSVLMMLDTDDRLDAVILGIAGVILVVWSLYLFEDRSTLIFIAGLLGIGLGYAVKMGTWYRNALLFVGSVCIAIFSYLGQDWIFFWLNVFFALFSFGYMMSFLRKSVAQ